MPRSSGRPVPSTASRITAPAPSPKRTQVARSLKSRMREKVSAPITITRGRAPVRMRASAWARAKTKPAQTAWMSKAKPPAMPIAVCTLTAVEGKVWSGVAVARMIASMSAPREAGVGEGGAGGGDREVGGRLALGGEVAALDAGAGADPFVGGVEGPGELVVLDDALGQVVAAAERNGAEHAHVVSPCWASAGCVGGADAGGELAGEAVVGEGEGEADGRGHRRGVGRAVRLDDRAVEAEEDPAVRAPRVDAVLQALERGQGEERADAARAGCRRRPP